MKKIVKITLSAVTALVFAACNSTGFDSLPSIPIDASSDADVVGYYTFEEAVEDNELVDHSAAELNVWTGALDGSELTEGIKGQGLRFNGEDEFITLEADVLSGAGFTFAAWIKADMWNTWSRIFDFGDTKTDVFLGVDGRTPGTLVLREEGSQIQVNTPLPEMEEWNHIAATFGDGQLVIFVNGVRAAEVPCGVTPEQVGATAQGLYIGRSNWADPLFKGVMDNIVVAKRILGDGEIAHLYKIDAPEKVAAADEAIDADPFEITEDSGVIGYFTFDEGVEDNEAVDHSGAGLNVYTGSLDPSAVTDGKNGKALVFNGQDEYITLEPETLEGEGVTIAVWVQPTAWSAWSRILDFGNQVEDMWLGMDGGSSMLRLDVIGAKGNVTLATKLPQIGTWTHVAVTLGDGLACLYINGKLVQKNGVGVTPADIAANALGLYIGRSNWPDPLYVGNMDDLLVANRAFSKEEIASVYAGVISAE
ncbi:MAG: LamG domain-containing protein [Treponema sp.]|nr:LamG domain-containing protein [Treponema sp.]